MQSLLQNKLVHVQNLGMVDYQDALNIQNDLFHRIINIKLNNTKNDNHQKSTPNYLILCEHPHTYTLGRSGSLSHLLVNQKTLQASKTHFYHTDRGGDITYHGPGQIIVYPILDLSNFFNDIHMYLRTLEEAIITTLDALGLQGDRIPGYTGVWIQDHYLVNPRKICAIGIKVSRWVTMHGLALNVHPDLTYFQNIIPCGLINTSVTSINKELQTLPCLKKITDILINKILQVFNMKLVF